VKDGIEPLHLADDLMGDKTESDHHKRSLEGSQCGLAPYGCRSSHEADAHVLVWADLDALQAQHTTV